MAQPNSRDTLLDYCLRRLGAPVIEINVDADQLEDKLDDALQLYQEYHSDGIVRTYKSHLVDETNVNNGYIDIAGDVVFVTKVFPPISTVGGSASFFDIKYQMMLNDMGDMQRWAADLAYYEQMQQYLSMLDMKLNGTPQVQYSRHGKKLYLFGDFEDKDFAIGDYIVYEAMVVLDPNINTTIYNDMFLKDYLTALIKQQWGANLMKFEGMTLPGGVQFNGRQFYEDATQDIEQLRERVRMEFELPPDFLVG